MMISSRSSGFSLIEVLISIVILSIGLLGTAGLMGASLRNTNTAYYRSQATVLADDILDRMRANLPEARVGQYDVTPGPSCAATSAMAQFDCQEWSAALAEALPGGVGTVDVESTGVVTITIEWENGENSFSTRSQL